MQTLRTVIGLLWLAFWVYWLLSAIGVKRGTRRLTAPGMRVVVIVLIAVALLHGHSDDSSGSVPVSIVGLAVVVCGLGLAVWARIYLGRNWGMPMTVKQEPELVTSGPYRRVRNPIYTGILLAMLGSALGDALFWFVPFAVFGAYFVYAARVEERNMASTFPDTYPAYRARTWMLIPFVL